MVYRVKKTEHAGAKKGKGFHGRKADAKHESSRARRQNAKSEIEVLLICPPVSPFSSVEKIEDWIKELGTYPDCDETEAALKDAKELLKERKTRIPNT